MNVFACRRFDSLGFHLFLHFLIGTFGEVAVVFNHLVHQQRDSPLVEQLLVSC